MKSTQSAGGTRGHVSDAARESFVKWIEASKGEIHVDAINEAAFGYRSGWDAATEAAGARERVLVEALKRIEENVGGMTEEFALGACERLEQIAREVLNKDEGGKGGAVAYRKEGTTTQ
jgi:hypothetical protein